MWKQPQLRDSISDCNFSVKLNFTKMAPYKCIEMKLSHHENTGENKYIF